MRAQYWVIYGVVLGLAGSMALYGCNEAGVQPGEEIVVTEMDQYGNDNAESGSDVKGGESEGWVHPALVKFNENIEVYEDGEWIVIRTNGLPDHGSPYYSESDSRYEEYNGTNSRFRKAPGTIREQDVTFRIPKEPQEDMRHPATPLGPIGVATNGVVFYNQYAAGMSPLDNEINSFDQYNGHPQQQGQYHYHVEPVYITGNQGKDVLVGYLSDGFPVYGPVENGVQVRNADLDDYHGHIGITEDYPEGIYHYHITLEDPYINGAGYYGTPGTISR